MTDQTGDEPDMATADRADVAAGVGSVHHDEGLGSGSPGPSPSTVPGEQPTTVEEVEAAAASAEAHVLASDTFTPDQIDALVAERDQFLDAYRRTAADFDNFRKQSQKRILDEIARTQGNFVERLLPVLDAAEAARAHGSEDVEAVAGALFLFLEKEGLEAVRPEGEPFDPNTAEAVMHEPGTGEPVVTEVFRTGYRWQGRVIRPAMVKVSG